MPESGWNNPWKLTAIGMALVVVTVLVTGLVVAQWSGGPADRKATEQAQPGPTPARAARAESVPPTPVARRTAAASAPHSVSTVPTQAAVEACHQEAAAQVGQRNKTTEIVKDGAIGAVAGAAIGAAGGAIAGGGRGAGTGAAIGGLVGAGGGSLYGLNDNQKHDQQYRDAYAACMRARGHTG
jgi:hypothetical protein